MCGLLLVSMALQDHLQNFKRIEDYQQRSVDSSCPIFLMVNTCAVFGGTIAFSRPYSVVLLVSLPSCLLVEHCQVCWIGQTSYCSSSRLCSPMARNFTCIFSFCSDQTIEKRERFWLWCVYFCFCSFVFSCIVVLNLNTVHTSVDFHYQTSFHGE